jgi:ABC-2 type transport system ATP-binding protein
MDYTVDLYSVDRQEATRVLHAKGLRKRYREVTALDGFDLDVARGEIVGLIGHNGAGKSTFVSIVSGLVRADGGELAIGTKKIGVAPQTLGLYPTATVGEHLRLFANLHGVRGGARDDRGIADELLLTELLGKKVKELSGGQQRRVQAATALVHRPELLLLDEPTVGADPVTRDALLAAVRRQADRGAAVLYTTHYLPELDKLDATLAVAQHGRVIARGSRAELLKDHPATLAATFADGREVSMPTTDPSAALAELLKGGDELPEHIDIRSPSLDDLYAALT